MMVDQMLSRVYEKKSFMRIFFCTIIVACMLLWNSNSVSVAEDVNVTTSNFKVKIGDALITEDTRTEEMPTVSDGDELQIEFDWFLANRDDITSFSVNLSDRISNIEIVNVGTQTLTKDSEEVGTYTINNGILKVEFFPNTAFITGDERFGGLKIKGKISIDDTVAPTDTSIPIKIGTLQKQLPYENKAYADIQKELVNGITINADGKMQQTYEVTITSKDGEILINGFSDIPGNKLSQISNVVITENTVTDLSTLRGQCTMSELQSLLANKKIKENEILKFRYSYVIDNTVYDALTDAATYTNTASVTYNNKPEPVADTATPVINKPTVSKTGVLVESTGKNEVEWTISVKLNDFDTVDWNTLVTQIKDVLGTGLVGQGTVNTLDKSKFTLNSETGAYEYKYLTEIDESYLDTSSKKEVTNDVSITLNHPIYGTYTYSETGKTQIVGRNWITKTAKSFDSEKRIVTWEIKLENIPADITNVKVIDTVDNGQLITNSTVRVKGSDQVETLICENGVNVENTVGAFNPIDPNRFTLTLNKEFIKANAGKDVYIYLTSQLPAEITDSYAQSAFINTAQLFYYENGIQYNYTARAEFKDTSNCISKEGKVVEGKATITYDVFVDMTKLDIKVGDVIHIEDVLPKGLALDTSKGKNGILSKYINRRAGGGATNTWIKDLSSMLNVSQTGGTVNVDITVNTTLYNSWLNDRNAAAKDRRAIQLTYDAYVEDESRFIRNGEVVTFTNYVTGIHNGSNIGSAECPLDLTPKSVVNKLLEIPDANKNIVKYTVEINEYKFDLSDGMIRGVDVLGRGLTYKLDNPAYPVVVEKKLDDGTWKVLEEAVDYTYVFYTENNSLVFMLPDETHLKISYYADINIRKEEYYKESLATNTFSLEGIKDFPQSGVKVLPKANVEPISWVDYTLGKITLFKYWNNNGQLTALPDTKFALYETVANGNSLELGNLLRDDIVVDSQGKVVIGNLNVDKIYALVEKEVVVGYERIDDPYYFVLPGSNMQVIPDGYNVQYFIDGSTLYFENRKVDTGYLNIRKITDGISDWSEVADKIEFVITRNGVENYRIKGTELDSITHGKKIEVNVGTYEVTEEITLPDGYKCETTYIINANPAKDGVIASDVNIKANETTTIDFTNTYEEIPKEKGKLTIQKEHSVLEWDEVKKSIKFEVYEGSTLVQTIQGSELDASKSYMLELVPGTYTVKEILTEVDGYTCTTKYAVGSASEEEGKEAVVEVESEKTSTLIFTNTYEKVEEPTETPDPTPTPEETPDPKPAPEETPDPTPTPEETPDSKPTPEEESDSDSTLEEESDDDSSQTSTDKDKDESEDVKGDEDTSTTSPSTGDEGFRIALMVFLASCLGLAIGMYEAKRKKNK